MGAIWHCISLAFLAIGNLRRTSIAPAIGRHFVCHCGCSVCQLRHSCRPCNSSVNGSCFIQGPDISYFSHWWLRYPNRLGRNALFAAFALSIKFGAARLEVRTSHDASGRRCDWHEASCFKHLGPLWISKCVDSQHAHDWPDSFSFFFD